MEGERESNEIGTTAESSDRLREVDSTVWTVFSLQKLEYRSPFDKWLWRSVSESWAKIPLISEDPYRERTEKWPPSFVGYFSLIYKMSRLKNGSLLRRCSL